MKVLEDVTYKLMISKMDEQRKEIERLNNIINEIKERASYEETNAESLSKDILSIIDEKLQELKGSDK